jgi:hypothetical protein
MWDQAKRARFQELRQREAEGRLSEEERATLAAMLRELDEQEEALLGPAIERMRAERERLETQNENLRSLLQRQERLADRLRAVISDAEQERKAIHSEVERILAGRT